MALETALENLKKKRDAYDAAAKEFTREKIAEALGPLIPENYRLAWTAYIPGFNDGEPCTYSLGEVSLVPAVTSEGEDDESEESADQYTDAEEHEHSFSLSWGDPSTEDLHAGGITRKAYEELKRAWKLIPEDVIEKSFGPDVVVAIKPDGTFLVEDFYCGY